MLITANITTPVESLLPSVFPVTIPPFNNSGTLVNNLDTPIFPCPTINDPAGWDSLRIESKANCVMEQLLNEHPEFNKSQIDYFYNELDKDLCDQWILRWWILPFKEQKSVVKIGLIDLALNLYLTKYPEISFLSLCSYGISLLTDDELLKHVQFIQELHLIKLRKNLTWINLKEAENLIGNSLELFTAILSYNKHPFPPDSFWNNSQRSFEQLHPLTKRSLEETALLWNQLRTDNMFDGLQQNDGQFSLDSLRKTFFLDLAQSYKRQQLIDKLFVESLEDDLASNVHFNGITFKNAQNLTFEDLIKRPEVERIPEYNALSREDKCSIMKEALTQMGESSEYPLGTLSHALASCVKRIFQYQYPRRAFPLNDKQLLIELYKKIEKDWEKNKGYPLLPRVLCAQILSESNGVTIAGEHWQTLIKNYLEHFNNEFEEILDPLYVEQLPAKFDKEQAVVAYLKEECGWEEDDIRQESLFRIRKPQQSPMVRNTPELYLANKTIEFFLKAETNRVHPFPLSNFMLCTSGSRIDPKTVLDKLQKMFNERLFHDPWVEEEARQNLLKQKIENTPLNLSQEVRRIVEKYRVETENIVSWANNTRQWLDTVPVIGSLRMFVRGIRDKEFGTTIIGGGLSFLDIGSLFSLKPIVASSVKTMSLYLARTSSRGKKAIRTLRASVMKFNLPSNDLTRLESSFFSAVRTGPQEIPSAYKSLVEEVRLGALDKTWQANEEKNYLLVYLIDEDRVVPVAHQGGSFREVNWQTGQLETTKPLIYKDKSNGRYFASALRGGGKESQFDNFFERKSAEELEQRYTVIEVKEILKNAKDVRVHANDLDQFKRFFIIISENDRAEQNFIENLDQEAYQTSPLYRRLFNRFIEICGAKPEENQWKIQLLGPEESSQFQGGHANLQSKVILLDPQIAVSGASYLGENIGQINHNGEFFRKVGSYLHELLHAITNVDDLFSAAPSVKALASQTNRGGIACLTDRILEEMGKHIPYRYTYSLYNSHSLNPSVVGQIRNFVVQENSYLQKLFFEGTTMEAYSKLSDTLALSKTVTAVKDYSRGIQRELRQLEGFVIVSSADVRTEFKTFCRSLYRLSTTFKEIFDKYYVGQGGEECRVFFYPIYKIVDDRTFAELTQREIIYSLDDEIRYLSDRGLSPMNKERFYLYQMLERYTNTELGAGSVEDGRGLIVYLAEKIFVEAGMDFDKAVSGALILPGDAGMEAKALQNWPRLCSTANHEDRYLAEFFSTTQPGCSPACSERRDKRSAPLAEKKSLNEIFKRTDEIVRPIQQETKKNQDKNDNYFPYVNSKKYSQNFFKKELYFSQENCVVTTNNTKRN